MANAKRFGCKIGIQFNKTSLFTDKKNYATKIVNAYIDYHLEYISHLDFGVRKAFDVAGS